MLDDPDLDGALVLAEDPYAGVDLPAGQVELECMSRAGTSAELR